MRRPMAEIQRPGGAKFEGIAGVGDMIDVQLGAPTDELLHRRGLKVTQFGGVSFDGVKKSGVPDACDFNRFDVAGAFVARWEGGEHLKIMDHAEGHREGADKILFSKRVDRIFYP